MNDNEFQKIAYRVAKTLHANQGKDPLTYLTVGEAIVATYLAKVELGVGGDENVLRSDTIELYVTLESMGVISEPAEKYLRQG